MFHFQRFWNQALSSLVTSLLFLQNVLLINVIYIINFESLNTYFSASSLCSFLRCFGDRCLGLQFIGGRRDMDNRSACNRIQANCLHCRQSSWKCWEDNVATDNIWLAAHNELLHTDHIRTALPFLWDCCVNISIWANTMKFHQMCFFLCNIEIVNKLSSFNQIKLYIQWYCKTIHVCRQ